MTPYESNLSLTEVSAKIKEAKKMVVTTHAKPDGDAFGSAVALSSAAKQIGCEVKTVLMPPVPVNFESLKGYELILKDGPDITVGDADLMVMVDTGAWSQIAPMRERIEPILDRTLILDHHVVGDVPAAWRYIDAQSAACCEVVAAVIGQMQDDTGQDLFSPTVCDALFVGLASDTGWFRFSNTRSQSHELAADLIRRGVDQSELYTKLEQTERPEKLALMIRALDSLMLIGDNQVAIMVLRTEDFQKTGAFVEETERIVDLPQSVESVRVVVLITEVSSGQPETAIARLSFRSKAGELAVNVAKLAQEFGGGGHALAAGAKLQAPIDHVVDKVRQTVLKLI